MKPYQLTFITALELLTQTGTIALKCLAIGVSVKFSPATDGGAVVTVFCRDDAHFTEVQGETA